MATGTPRLRLPPRLESSATSAEIAGFTQLLTIFTSMRPPLRSALACLAAVTLSVTASAEEKLNILWLLAEDIGPTVFATYGQKKRGR